VKSYLTTLVVLILSAALFAGVLFFYIFFPASQTPQTVEIRVEQGDSFATVVRRLREQNIIRHEIPFSLWARVIGSEKKIQPGLYRFELPLRPREALNQMVSGKGIFQRVTIPEGLTIKEVSDLLANMQVVNREKFLSQARDPALLAQLGVDDKTVEGYLFPSTYQFIPETPEKEIIAAMVQQFRKAAAPLFEGHTSALELTPHQIVTLASIIEKETGIESERPLVSAVFHNRLKLKMPLQSDPTVIYGLKNFDGNLTRKHVKEPSPYNTYVIAGLPPGPICNPGLSSIKAALAPADVPFLYFVSKNDGTHLFSATLDEHARAVKMYQPPREPAPARRKIEARRG
jgi:UPF0755 protein